MSAPRTKGAIASDLAEWRKGVSSQPLKAVMMEAIAALRPALPAEVEAVIADLEEHANDTAPDSWGCLRAHAKIAATLLRRYARSVVDLMDDNESLRVIAEEAQSAYERTTSENEANLAQAVAEKDAEIARLTAIEERAKSYRALLTPGSYCEISECQVFDDMTVILWEEH